MSKPAGGLRGRRRPDVLELLARARPASLDPRHDPQRPAVEVARLAAAGTKAAGTTAAAPTGAGPGRAVPARRDGGGRAVLRPACS